MTSYSGTLILPQVLMGLALFLFGMSQLEAGIHALGYATFKRWLTRSTASSLGSVSVGVGVTAVVQSSSMVSLLVLAFASAGVLPLVNAIGVLLGANLGTTITGWMVATIGFKLSLQLFALPLMAGGAIMQLMPRRRGTLRAFGTLTFGFGMLVFGLDIMKNAVEGMALSWDLAVLRGHGLWLYFVAGAGIAALVQSSSATMMMTLAALHAGLFDLQSAAALVIGADLGTTSTTALGSIAGHHVKRQLALAHVIFNVVVDTGAFFFLLPLLPWVVATLGLSDPLYSLVAFHSLFNVLGLMVFVPLLRPFSAWIGQRFDGSESAHPSLVGVPSNVPDAALAATASLLASMQGYAALLSLHTFNLAPRDLKLREPIIGELSAIDTRDMSLDERYQDIKQMESELLAFTMDLQAQPLTPAQVATLTQQGAEARAMVYSSKTFKDIRHNLTVMRDSSSSAVKTLYAQHRSFIQRCYETLLALPAAGGSVVGADPSNDEPLRSMLVDNESHLQAANTVVRDIAASDEISGSELSSMLNVNREVHHAIKSMIAHTQ